MLTSVHILVVSVHMLESNFSKSLSIFQCSNHFYKIWRSDLVEERYGARGVNAGEKRSFRAYACEHVQPCRPRKPLCFSNSAFDSCINSPSVHNSFTATRPRRRFWMQNPRESKQSAGGGVCAVRFDNNPRALFWCVLPTAYFLPILCLSLFLFHPYACIERLSKVMEQFQIFLRIESQFVNDCVTNILP